MKNKCTLLIDGNWLLMSRFSVMQKLFLTSNSNIELNTAVDQLQDMMARSISVVLNKIPCVDNIIFISDGGSWRKQLPVPDQLSDTTYKGNREESKGEEISWNHVFRSLNKLSKRCEEQGITTSTQANIEGDDWVWYWSRRLNREGINCIIWSSDNDLKQLIQTNNGTFTTWYTERSGKVKWFLPESLELSNPEEGDLDFFLQPIRYKSPIQEELEKRLGKVTYVDPNTIITSKVICGDAGDNIKSVVRMPKNGRTYGVGEKDWEKIAIKLGIRTIYDLIEHKYEIAKEISGLKKFSTYEQATHENILEMIEYNIKLVWLNEEVIPETIIAVMNQQEYKQFDVTHIRGSYKVLMDEDDEVKNIFENIPF